MVLQGFKKVIWLLIGSTILSSIFSIAMITLVLKSYNEIIRIKRQLLDKNNKIPNINKYRQSQ